MGLIADELCQDLSEAVGPTEGLIDWRQRYDGVLMVAYLDRKAVAGVSGPWPVNKYALTWWDRPMPARQLELFDSLAAAQRRVDEWAFRMRTIGVIDRSPANDPIVAEATVSIAPERTPSLFEKLRDAIVSMPRRMSDSMDRMHAVRREPLNDDALDELHFAAFE